MDTTTGSANDWGSNQEAKTTEAKRQYLKKLGNLNLAEKAVDIEDHREVMAINRSKLRNDIRIGMGKDGNPTMESYEVELTDDPMRVGDDTHNHYYEKPKTRSALGTLPALALLAGGLMGGAGLTQMLGLYARPSMPTQVDVNEASPTLITQPPAFILEGAEVLEDASGE